MKKQLQLLIFLFAVSVLCVQAQTLELANGKFENWTTINGIDYPNDWDISDTSEVKNYIKKVTDAGEGKFAIRFNSYSGLEAPYVEIYDSIPDGITINQVEFKLKAGNISNQFTDGAVVWIFKYDKNWDYLADQVIRISNNTGGWVDVKQSISMGSVKYILVMLELWDFSKSGAYAIFDDIKFSKKTVGVDDINQVTTSIFPNPAKNQFVLESEKQVTKIQIIDQLGRTVKQIDSLSKSNPIDVSELESGIYYVTGTVEGGGTFYKKLIKE